jgi:hypothetical protein
MTLKERILPLVADGSYVELTVRSIEEIVEDFAIGFAEWVLLNPLVNQFQYSIKDLLEIYKKENQL